MRAFTMRPIPKAYDVVECYIERNKSGANKMFPEYCLYMKEGDRFLLTAKKRPKNRTSNYLISLQRGDLLRRGSDNYVGKLRANFLGTEFTIYDNGSNPKDADQQTITSNPAGIRQELGIAMYAANVLGHRGPRKMKVCVPRVREDGTRVVWRPLTKEDEMVNKCKEQDHTNLTYLINKPPRWNDQVCAYVLNFNGRVTMASVKNFQLVTPEDQETVVLQFGRVGKDLFTMDFRWPLCPLQAFAITLSSFDSKLACE
ncbi:Dihydroorotase [Phytophthora nicotianae]|nr:Dihydroorotase [Phytophthora nicotianae]